MAVTVPDRHESKVEYDNTYFAVYDDAIKIIKRPTHSKIVRERRRLKKYKILYDKGVVNELHIRNAYKSWRNGVTKDCNACKRTIKSMDRLYIELFPNKETRHKYNREYIIKTIFRKEKLWILENAL